MTITSGSHAPVTECPDGMQFRLLGSLTVSRDGASIPITSGKQRAVLAALLVRANRYVSADELIGTVWSDPPKTALVTTQNYVKRLRQALGPSGRTRLVSRPSGYLISASESELDLTAFLSGCAAGHRAAAAGAGATAVRYWRDAFSLWRGVPFADVPSDILANGERRRLQEIHLDALESQLEWRLRFGQHVQVLAEARTLTAAEPFRERLHEILMLALYRSGQRAEALAAYRHVRTLLTAEIGVEPGLVLRRLHQQILNDEPLLHEYQRYPSWVRSAGNGMNLPANPAPGTAGRAGTGPPPWPPGWKPRSARMLFSRIRRTGFRIIADTSGRRPARTCGGACS